VVHGAPLALEAGQGAQTVAGYLQEVSTRFAGREALVFHSPGAVQRWTYNRLWENSLQVARALAAGGVGQGSRVGILMTNRPEFLSAAFGIALAGGVIVPLNTFSTPPELKHLLNTSCIGTLLFERRVVDRDFVAILSELEPAVVDAKPGALASGELPWLQRLVAIDPGQSGGTGCIEYWEEFLRRGDSLPPAVITSRQTFVAPTDAAVRFLSSGTTGVPKGILHSQRAVAIQWWRWPRFYRMGDDVRTWTANGFFWSGNFSMTIGTALSTGGALVLQRFFDPEEALRLMQQERVTAPYAVKHQWARMERATGYGQADLGSIRYIDLNLAMSPLHPSIVPSEALPNAFGTTETLTIVTSCRDDVPEDRKRDSFGPPLPGNSIKIVSPSSGEIVPRGEHGEIAVKGPTLMMGYVGQPAEECFDAEGYYLTGDGGHLDDAGCLHWAGRLTDIIKTGGASVSPVEIDTVILSHPGVKLTQTIGVPDEALGELVVACVVPREGGAVDEEALRRFLRERLASYKVPRHIVFLDETDIAMTGSAKVKAEQLRTLVCDRLGVHTAGATA